MQVIDSKHGIEVINEGSEKAYYPYYYRAGHTYYYTQYNNWHRVRYTSYNDAYNHIARSRRLHTIGGNNGQ